MRPEITYDVRTDSWEVTDDFCYTGHGVEVFIQAGFKTDLASIPRFFWRFMAPHELSIAAPLVHDSLYRNGGIAATPRGTMFLFTREQTDNLFLQIMEEEGVSWWKRNSAYRAVRLFAWASWKNKPVMGVL